MNYRKLQSTEASLFSKARRSKRSGGRGMKNSRASRQCRGQPIGDRRLIRFRNCSVLPALDPRQTKRIIPAEARRRILTFDKVSLKFSLFAQILSNNFKQLQLRNMQTKSIKNKMSFRKKKNVHRHCYKITILVCTKKIHPS